MALLDFMCDYFCAGEHFTFTFHRQKYDRNSGSAWTNYGSIGAENNVAQDKDTNKGCFYPCGGFDRVNSVAEALGQGL
jgi:hypothetical protein